MLSRILMLLLCLCLTAGCACADDAAMTLIAINVGKADSLLLHYGENLYLIDTGTKESWGALSKTLKQMGVAKLDGVIVTHTDKDHAGGAWALAQSPVEIGAWYAPGYFTDVKEAKHPVMLAAQLRGQDVQWLSAGDTLPFGGGELRVIGPMSHDESKENNNSLVLVASGAGGAMLLAGDMEFPEEEELLAAGVIPPCQVLKVGNHGEGDATSEALVKAVKPQVAVISTNTKEEPDTPDVRVMGTLRKAGAAIVQTQDAQAGVLVTLQNGRAETQMLSYGQLPGMITAVELIDKSVGQDAVSIRNNGSAAVDLAGWYIVSEKGKELFVFPAGSVIQPGQVQSITSLSSEDAGDYTWPEKKVWHKSKPDTAKLYDPYGRLIGELE